MTDAMSPIPLIPVAEDMVLNVRVNVEGLTVIGSFQDTSRGCQRYSVSQNHPMPFLLSTDFHVAYATGLHGIGIKILLFIFSIKGNVL